MRHMKGPRRIMGAEGPVMGSWRSVLFLPALDGSGVYLYPDDANQTYR